MPDTKITALAAITTVAPSNDLFPIVDVSDNSMAASGTTKNITVNQLLGAGGIAALSSATISGDLTVDTSTLKVDSANNRVGIGTASPAVGYTLDVVGSSRITGPGVTLTLDKTGAAALQLNASGNAGAQLSTSGTGGLLVYTANGIGGAMDVRHQIASDGVATWQNVGGSSGTAMTLNATGLGIGAAPELKLRVDGPDAAPATSGSSTTNGAFRIGAVGASTNLCVDAGVSTAGGVYGWFQARSRGNYALNYDIVLNPNGGNVGIGVTPSARFHSKAGAVTQGGIIETTGANAFLSFADAGTSSYTRVQIGSSGNNLAAFINSVQAMTLDGSGNLLVGKTTSGAFTDGCQLFPAGTISVGHPNGTGSGAAYSIFAYNSVKTGDITQNGTTGVLYNTVSDYRLKESVAPMSGGLARVNALKPSIYKWKSDGSAGEGFLAHELAEVVPTAVTGEKDAVNEDGSIKTQSVDLSRIVPILVAAIKELTAEVNALKNA